MDLNYAKEEKKDEKEKESLSNDQLIDYIKKQKSKIRKLQNENEILAKANQSCEEQQTHLTNELESCRSANIVMEQRFCNSDKIIN